MRDSYMQSAPVKEGDELDVKIEAIGDKGDGIAKKDGFVLVIPGTKVNDNVRIKVTRVLKKVGFAEVVGQAEESDDSEEETEESEEESEESDDSEEEADFDEDEEEPEDDFAEDEEDSEDFGDDDKN